MFNWIKKIFSSLFSIRNTDVGKVAVAVAKAKYPVEAEIGSRVLDAIDEVADGKD